MSTCARYTYATLDTSNRNPSLIFLSTKSNGASNSLMMSVGCSAHVCLSIRPYVYMSTCVSQHKYFTWFQVWILLSTTTAHAHNATHFVTVMTGVDTCKLSGQCHGRDVISPSFGFMLLFDWSERREGERENESKESCVWQVNYTMECSLQFKWAHEAET